MKYTERARLYGISYAETMYKDFTEHPEYRGLGFNWLLTENAASGLAAASFYGSFNKVPKKLEELKIIVKEAASARWRELCRADGRA